MEQQEFNADPQQLRAEAEKEPSHKGLDHYFEAIRVLKEDKGFSYREIAAWLQQRGLNVDHNAVWRAYSKTMRGGSADRTIERYEQYEHNTPHGGAMPWLGES
jgi:hypothetical protein